MKDCIECGKPSGGPSCKPCGVSVCSYKCMERHSRKHADVFFDALKRGVARDEAKRMSEAAFTKGGAHVE
jgi:hypothetical protein